MKSMRTVTSLALVLGMVGAGALRAPASESSGESLREALASSARAEADRARDAGRKPADVVSFLGIEQGMTVVDLIAAGGYYTEVLSLAVGPAGTVYSQNPAVVLRFREGANDRELSARLQDGRLGNVVRWDREIRDIGLEPESVDAVLTALNFHDVYNQDPTAAAGMLAVVYGVLKPGGTLGLIDHDGSPGADNARLHRVPLQDVISAATAAGFAVEATSDLLRNAGDDHAKSVFDPAVRGKTDRFLLRLRKPS